MVPIAAGLFAGPALGAGGPQNTAPPQISGTPVALQTLTASTGSWIGAPPISYSYQWQSCDARGANCDDLAGADGPTYTPSDTDVDNNLQVVVTATDRYGSTSATSPLTSAVRPEPPPVNDRRRTW